MWWLDPLPTKVQFSPLTVVLDFGSSDSR
jgi:hypothetical protein